MPFFRFSTVADRSHYYSCYIAESSFAFVAVYYDKQQIHDYFKRENIRKLKIQIFRREENSTKSKLNVFNVSLSVSAFLKDIFIDGYLHSAFSHLEFDNEVVSGMDELLCCWQLSYYDIIIRIRWWTRINSNIHTSLLN